MSGKAGPIVTGAAILGLLAAGLVSTVGGDIAVYDGASLTRLPARLKTGTGPRHTFGQQLGECAQGSRYCTVVYDASTDHLDLEHCYAIVQLADAEGSPYTACQVTAEVWRQMTREE